MVEVVSRCQDAVRSQGVSLCSSEPEASYGEGSEIVDVKILWNGEVLCGC